MLSWRSPINILYISTWDPFPPTNGSELRAYYLLRALAERHQVTLLASRPQARTASQGADLAPPHGLTMHTVPVDPFRYVDTPQLLKFLSPIPLALWPSALMRQAARRMAATTAFDAVVAFELPAASYALLFTGVPRLLDVDTALGFALRERMALDPNPLARVRAWLSWRKAWLAERYLLPRFQCCTVVSPHELPYTRALVAGHGCQVTVSPNGVDCDRNRPGEHVRAPNTLVYNGSLTYSANYDAMRYFLADIYPLIRERVPEARLTITGSTSGVDLDGLGLLDGVRLSGYVDDIRPLVGGSQVCVIPLRQGAGTRIKILEAMALGTPVVSTTKGAEGLDLRDGEHLLLADDPRGFAECVMRLLQDAGLRQRLAASARRLVERQHDWGIIGRQFADLVEGITAGRG